MLYKNILKHESGFDYEFKEGAIVSITCICKDEFGGLDFYINGQPACAATVEEFDNTWTPFVSTGNMKKYLERFETCFLYGDPDSELEKIINEAADNIENDEDYSKFYEIVTEMIKERV